MVRDITCMSYVDWNETHLPSLAINVLLKKKKIKMNYCTLSTGSQELQLEITRAQ